MIFGVWIGIIGCLAPWGEVDKASSGKRPDPRLDAGVVARSAAHRLSSPSGSGRLSGIFPTVGLRLHRRRSLRASRVSLDTLWHLVLPVTTLTLAYLAEYSLVMRSSLLDSVSARTTSRPRGRRGCATFGCGAATPCATRCCRPRQSRRSASASSCRGRSPIETVFSIPGLGLLSTEALSVPDYWVLQGTFLVPAACVIVANLLVNLGLRPARPPGADMTSTDASTSTRTSSFGLLARRRRAEAPAATGGSSAATGPACSGWPCCVFFIARGRLRAGAGGP